MIPGQHYLCSRCLQQLKHYVAFSACAYAFKYMHTILCVSVCKTFSVLGLLVLLHTWLGFCCHCFVLFFVSFCLPFLMIIVDKGHNIRLKYLSRVVVVGHWINLIKEMTWSDFHFGNHFCSNMKDGAEE